MDTRVSARFQTECSTRSMPWLLPSHLYLVHCHPRATLAGRDGLDLPDQGRLRGDHVTPGLARRPDLFVPALAVDQSDGYGRDHAPNLFHSSHAGSGLFALSRCARTVERDVAIIAAIVFCLHPIIIFASIDVRPYAFAALAINASILALVHLRHNNSNWLAALFGLSAACIVQFQLLFAVILPALAVCFVAQDGRSQDLMEAAWDCAGALCVRVFAGHSQAVVHGPHQRHACFFSSSEAAGIGSTLTLRGLGRSSWLAVLVAAATRRLNLRTIESWTVLLCASLALVPILLLYGLSVGTSIHVFVPRYRLVAVPGIALCWALVVSWIDSRALRLLFCRPSLPRRFIYFTAPFFRRHQYSWKYALEFVRNASADNAPVLICSDIPEADHMAMPVGPAIQESGILPPLSYYKLSVPVRRSAGAQR